LNKLYCQISELHPPGALFSGNRIKFRVLINLENLENPINPINLIDPNNSQGMKTPLFPAGDKRKTLTLVELAELSGIRKTTLREWARLKQIPGAFRSTKYGRWLFRREDLEAWWADIRSRS
jgi:excisionase family DNA binding protein